MTASRPIKRRPSAARIILHGAQIVFLAIGILALGYYGYVKVQARAFQAYQSWRLDQLQQGKPASIVRFVKQWIPIPWPEEPGEPTQPAQKKQPESQPLSQKAPAPILENSNSQNPERSQIPPRSVQPSISEGSLIGKIEIPRIDLSAIVLEGIGTQTLRLAVGHLPGTPLPGSQGNIDLAAHRDTYFRGLRKVQKGDMVTLSTVSGARYQYRVGSITVVSPNNTEILTASAGPGLNLITCYPFNYIGAAPKRFVVHADEVDDNTASDLERRPPSEALPVSLQEAPTLAAQSRRAHFVRQRASSQNRKRVESGTSGASRAREEKPSTIANASEPGDERESADDDSKSGNAQPATPRPARIRAFFHRVFSRNKVMAF